jgi:GPH family glycoside/pentoside/hexuronide:cation symporter
VLLHNRGFWLSLLLNGLAWLAIAMVEAVFAYFLIYWARVSEADTPIFLATILASATIFLPVVNWLAKRFEKKWAFVIATAVWMALHIGMWWVPVATVAPVFVVAVLAGLGVSAAHVLPTAMGADVLESVELESGERQEGVFGGLSGFIQKLGSSLALAAVGWVLELTGYQPNALTQAPRALLGIRLLTTWVPAALLVGAIASAAAFPITRGVHRALNEELARRRAARRAAGAALDAE